MRALIAIVLAILAAEMLLADPGIPETCVTDSQCFIACEKELGRPCTEEEVFGPSDPDEEAALCHTDTECLQYCPPPADDPDCDGGPQDVSFNRGNYGSQP